MGKWGLSLPRAAPSSVADGMGWDLQGTAASREPPLTRLCGSAEPKHSMFKQRQPEEPGFPKHTFPWDLDAAVAPEPRQGCPSLASPAGKREEPSAGRQQLERRESCDEATESGLGAKGEGKEQENAASKERSLRENLRSICSGHRVFPSEWHS